jgi:chain length determinant protein EpsF
MNLEQLLLALKARYRIVVATTLVTLCAALAVTLLTPKMYTASSAVVIDVKYADPIAGSVSPAWQQPSFMATQLDIINSERVASRVVKMLKLDQQPDVDAEWRKATDGKGDLVAWIAGNLHAFLDAKPSRDSNVIAISWRGRDPKMAADVANAYAQAYIDTSLDLRRDPAQQYSKYFGVQALAARDRLQAALSAFQQNNQIIVVSDDRLDVEMARLNQLSTQLADVQNARADSQSRHSQARSNSGTIQEVLTSQLVQTLKSDLAQKESKLQEMSGNLGPNNPQYQRAQAEVASLRSKIAAESGQIASGVGTNDRINEQRVATLSASVEEQKARVLKLKQDRDAASVLQRDVDAAKTAYEAITQRVSQSNLESQSNQTNIAILNAAIEPSRASSPRLQVNMTLALLIGLMLGIAAALLYEQIDRRVRSIDDLSRVLGLPVMGSIGRARTAIGQRKTGALRWMRSNPAGLPGPGTA